jgi:flavin reductase (DIM6/NTAB) family NADH-FMN oxidoreductase RutF
MPVDAAEFATALRHLAAGVCLLTLQDDIDDVGTTVTSVTSVSARPPLVAVGLDAGGYPAELLGDLGRCAVNVLGVQHAIVASRFSSAGRPSARHLLQSVPWTRSDGGAIVLSDALVALDCRLDRLVPAGDHVLALLEVDAVPVANPGAPPLIRLRGRYVDASGAPLARP